MPGLSGFVSRERIAEPERLLELYQHVHALDNAEYVKASLAESHAAILLLRPVALSQTRKSASNLSDDGFHFFLEGEVFDSNRAPSGPSHKSRVETIDSLASMFRRFGRHLPENLNGEFNLVVYHSNSRALTILVDHLSTRPLFYMETPNGLHFGSEKKSILATNSVEADLDPVGLLQIFNHRHYIGNRTFIKGIKRLPPGAILEYKDGRTQLTQGARIQFKDRNDRARPDDLKREWKELLCDATSRRIPDDSRVIISLSAGLDSRAIALSIDRNHRPLLARTRGIEHSDELVFGRRIADRLGFEHLTENPGLCNPTKAADAIVWRTEGEATIFNGPTLLNHAELQRHGDFLAGGHLGDVCSGGHVDPRMFVPESRSAFAERMYDWYQNNTVAKLKRVFRQEFLDRYLPRVKAEFIESYGPVEQARNVDSHQLWDLYNRQTRMTMAAAPVDNHLFQRVSPFYDRNLIEFVSALPLKYRFGQVLYKALIHYMGPEIRDIPNSNTMQVLRAGVAANRWDHLRHLAKKLRVKVVPFSRSASRNPMGLKPSESKTDMLLLDPAIRARLESFVHSDHCDPDIFDKSAILSLLELHYSRQEDHGHLLGLVTTFSAALPMFVYRKTVECPQEAQPAAAARQALGS